MVSKVDNKLSDYDRLKTINLELSAITHKRSACRRKTSLYGALGGILLAASSIGFFHNIVNMDDEWTNNPNSPVYQEVSSDQTSFKLPIPVAFFGLFIGFGLFYKAKTNCAERELLCNREWTLNNQMRGLRDQMYPHNMAHLEKRHGSHKPEHKQPLNPEEARGEYVGVYSPPGTKQVFTEETEQEQVTASSLQAQAS